MGRGWVGTAPLHAHSAAEQEVTKFSCFPTMCPQAYALPTVSLSFLERSPLAVVPLEKEKAPAYPQPRVGGGEAWGWLDLACPSLLD